MPINEYEVGDRIKLITPVTVFQSNEDPPVPFDPDVVTFEVKNPAGVTTAYIYGTDANVTKPAVGSYRCDIDVELPGTWYYYVKGETGGVNRGADQGLFEVKEKNT